MIDLSKAARTAEQAAYAAGTHLQASRSRLAEVMITHRAPSDVVSAIDHEARTLIRDVVQRQFPEHHVADGTRDRDGAAALPGRGALWVVDPLDGRANYLRGYPQYAVSIALVEDGEPRVGVVYDVENRTCRRTPLSFFSEYGKVVARV